MLTTVVLHVGTARHGKEGVISASRQCEDVSPLAGDVRDLSPIGAPRCRRDPGTLLPRPSLAFHPSRALNRSHRRNGMSSQTRASVSANEEDHGPDGDQRGDQSMAFAPLRETLCSSVPLSLEVKKDCPLGPTCLARRRDAFRPATNRDRRQRTQRKRTVPRFGHDGDTDFVAALYTSRLPSGDHRGLLAPTSDVSHSRPILRPDAPMAKCVQPDLSAPKLPANARRKPLGDHDGSAMFIPRLESSAQSCAIRANDVGLGAVAVAVVEVESKRARRRFALAHTRGGHEREQHKSHGRDPRLHAPCWKRGPDARRRHRHLSHAHAGRGWTAYRSRPAGMTGASPMPFAPNGPSGAGTSTTTASIGHVGGARHRVVEPRPREEAGPRRRG